METMTETVTERAGADALRAFAEAANVAPALLPTPSPSPRYADALRRVEERRRLSADPALAAQVVILLPPPPGSVVKPAHDIKEVPHFSAPYRRAGGKYVYVLSAKDDLAILHGIEKHIPLAAIAENIGCCRLSLANYIHKNPLLQQAFTDAKDAMDDIAETRLFEKINKGDLGAITFYMPRQMRHRGYGDEPPETEQTDAPRVIFGGTIPEDAVERVEDSLRAAQMEVEGAHRHIPEIDATDAARALAARNAVADGDANAADADGGHANALPFVAANALAHGGVNDADGGEDAPQNGGIGGFGSFYGDGDVTFD